MTAKRRPYKTYSKEFKLEAVRRMVTSDRPAAEIASKNNEGHPLLENLRKSQWGKYEGSKF